jgi:hypothetical protein
MKSAAASPTGLYHLVNVYPSGRIKTRCGRDVNLETWTRVDIYDRQMYGKTLSTIAKMFEGDKCDRCFS